MITMIQIKIAFLKIHFPNIILSRPRFNFQKVNYVAINQRQRLFEVDRSLKAHERDDEQSVFPIVQGNLDPELRKQCATELTKRQVRGFAVGGLSGGESKDEFWPTVHICTDLLPTDKPRYLMGVGFAADLVIKPPISVTINHHSLLLAFLALVLLTKCSSCQGSPCQSDSWWDPTLDKCVQCTKCSDQLIALRPCQLHQDTICGSIHDLKIDLTILSQTEPNWKERRKERNESLIAGNNQHEIPWDWQAASLIVVAIACLVFFIAAAYVLIQHMRQWRQIERRLDRDVEELSAKLMAKLAQVQNLENASFFIENPVIESHAGPVEIRCVYLDQLLADKGNNKRKSTNRGGNIYIEES